MEEDKFNEYLDAAWLSFRKQLLEAHDISHHRNSLSTASNTSLRPATARLPKKNPTRSLTFDSSILQEIAAEEEKVKERETAAEGEREEGIIRPPLSNAPALLMSPDKSKPSKPSEIPDDPLPASPSSSAGEPNVKSPLHKSPVGSPLASPESQEPTVSSDESKGSRISRRSQRSNASAVMMRSLDTEQTPKDLERTGTQQTLDSQVDHTAETLRARLGVLGGMVSGKILYDASVALGLTRFSEQDVNTLVNRLADFVDLELEHKDQRFRVQRSATVTEKVISMRRSALTGPRDPSMPTVDPINCRPKWKWPEEHTSVPDFWRGRVGTDAPVRAWNVVPFRALVYAFVMDADSRKIFGNSASHFKAVKEILLASDTNRLVAELTFVRINDLAAPQTARDPFLFLEPFVALLIMANAILLGIQTDESLQDWPWWPVIELGFTGAMFCETIFRLCVLGRNEYFCGVESSWNYFDMFLLITSIVDIILTFATAENGASSPTQLLRAFRLARLTRMFRVFRLKFIKELQLMIKGLVGGLRTLVLAFALLFVVLYIIAVFATITIGRGPELDGTLRNLFRSVPSTMFTAFRCYSGECITEDGLPVALLLSNQFGWFFVLLYVAGYMLVTMGIFNVILAVYVDITMKAARENEARTSEQHERESIRVARLTRELVKKFKIAVETRQHDEEEDDLSRSPSGMKARSVSGDEEEGPSDQIQISKELFLLVIQDRQVQRLMDDLDLPKDRANLFEALDADSSGALHLAELAQGLLKVRGELKKTDTVATLLATKAVYATLEQMAEQIMDLRRDVAKAMGDDSIGAGKAPRSIFDY